MGVVVGETGRDPRRSRYRHTGGCDRRLGRPLFVRAPSRKRSNYWTDRSIGILERRVGVRRRRDVFDDASSSTLSSRLDELVDAGYLDRERYAESPPRVEYADNGDERCRRLQPLLERAAGRER